MFGREVAENKVILPMHCAIRVVTTSQICVRRMVDRIILKSLPFGLQQASAEFKRYTTDTQSGTTYCRVVALGGLC